MLNYRDRMFCSYYQDRMFCSYYQECKNSQCCDRALTEEVKSEAQKLRLPICQFAEPPHCYEHKSNSFFITFKKGFG